MKAVFPAQVFCSGREQVFRSPLADVQFSRFLVSKKPVVRFALLDATHVARYGLFDHWIPFTAQIRFVI